MKFTGLGLRLFLLASLVIVIIVVSIVSATSDEIDVYLCDTTSEMKECDGPDDKDTCKNVAGGVDCVLSACGHQLAKGLDISVSGADNPLADKGTATNFLAGLMIFWSLVPYMLMIVLVASFLFAADTTSLSFAFLLAFIAIVNEGLFKHILSEHRPKGSCLYFGSYGLPSGHAATSIGTLSYALLEVWIEQPNVTLARKALFTFVSLFFLAPVPYSRVYLHDHFGDQVGIGSAVGFSVAVLWFLFMYKIARTRIDSWIDNGCGRWFELRNTYRTDEPWMPAFARKGGVEESSAIEESTDLEEGLLEGGSEKDDSAPAYGSLEGDEKADEGNEKLNKETAKIETV